jgi:hypothetical protein
LGTLVPEIIYGTDILLSSLPKAQSTMARARSFFVDGGVLQMFEIICNILCTYKEKKIKISNCSINCL